MSDCIERSISAAVCMTECVERLTRGASGRTDCVEGLVIRPNTAWVVV